MTKKFSLNCKVGADNIPLDFYIGDPQENSHPIGFQMKFLSQKGVSVPENIVASLSSLNDIAKRNRISFEELFEYVSDQLNLEDFVKANFGRHNEISRSSQNKKS